MKVIGWLLVAYTVLIGATFVLEHQYASRAQLVQRVQVDEAAALFGEAGTPIGSPQMLIIDDPKAFVQRDGSGPKLVNEKYLNDNNIYPLQLQTVRYVAGMTRLGLALGGVAMFGAILLIRRTRAFKNQQATASKT